MIADDVLTPEEASALLKVPRRTLVELCRRGEVPGARKVGRRWRIPRAGLGRMFVEVERADLQTRVESLEDRDLSPGDPAGLDRRGLEEGRRGVRSADAARAPGRGPRRS